MTNDYYENLPKKRMGCGVLIFNDKNELLIVKPNYKDHWSIPGGVIDENESPLQACMREVKEEVGLELKNPKFLGVAYYANSQERQKGEALQFMFYGGILNADQIEKIKIPKNELSEYKFLKIETASPLLNIKLQNRILKCLAALKQNKAFYLEE